MKLRQSPVKQLISPNSRECDLREYVPSPIHGPFHNEPFGNANLISGSLIFPPSGALHRLRRQEDERHWERLGGCCIKCDSLKLMILFFSKRVGFSMSDLDGRDPMIDGHRLHDLGFEIKNNWQLDAKLKIDWKDYSKRHRDVFPWILVSCSTIVQICTKHLK